MHPLLVSLLSAQAAAALLALARLLPGARRRPPVVPRDTGPAGAITIVVPTMNEAARIGPCLDGLAAQSAVVDRVLVVDSRSTDGTRELVLSAAVRNPRIEFVTDTPAPPGWIGKVWALQHALALVQTPWVLGIDADTVPQSGMAGGALAAAIDGNFDVVSFAPRFAAMTPAERWVQPAILATLVYRTGVPGTAWQGNHVLANGQCFLAKRDVLERAGGYASAATSWADDVTLARTLDASGARVGFLDGARLYDVRAYASLGEMWREWGRSVDLSDANSRVRQWSDIALLVLAQALPLLILLSAGVAWATGATALGSPLVRAIVMLNAALFALRLALLRGLARSYAQRGIAFWLSPLADVAAVFRIVVSTLRRPRHWRGRAFQPDSV